MDDAAFDVIVSMNGFHAFPNKEAAQIAVETVVEFLQKIVGWVFFRKDRFDYVGSCYCFFWAA